MRRPRRIKNYDERIASLESTRRWLLTCSGLLSLFGLSLGAILYNGYSSLKQQEAKLRGDYASIMDGYASATNDLEAIRAAETAIVGKCEDLKVVCSNIVQKSKAASEQVDAIESDCRLAQDILRGLDKYVAENLKVRPQKFVINITGTMATCTFVEGTSVPCSRTISGKLAKAVVTVPPGCICVVNPIGKMCRLRIQNKVRDRVTVESCGKMSQVDYFN